MKTQGTITSVRLKSVRKKDEVGRTVGADTHWQFTISVPAHRIDANELKDLAQEVLAQIEVLPVQTKLEVAEMPKKETAKK